VREERLMKRGEELSAKIDEMEDVDDIDDLPEAEAESAEEQVVDQATAARTIAELSEEIEQLRKLEGLALAVKASGKDKKWDELSSILHKDVGVFHSEAHRRKMVIFTEHRDTLNYLANKLKGMIGRPDAVVTVHGSMPREERRKAQESFTQDKDTLIFLATDAAGEGINLQRAHLMVNYDLPWNTNRIEQRFRRIDRIGRLRSATSGICWPRKPAKPRSIGVCSLNWRKNALPWVGRYSISSVSFSARFVSGICSSTRSGMAMPQKRASGLKSRLTTSPIPTVAVN
jgi:superfamily II DNA/RNA helicase